MILNKARIMGYAIGRILATVSGKCPLRVLPVIDIPLSYAQRSRSVGNIG
ncbi:hypothetical protein [Lacimicrobium sp. SS2-24]|nr:hypothetical protein [Lacimicrobium sp. SS2-24]